MSKNGKIALVFCIALFILLMAMAVSPADSNATTPKLEFDEETCSVLFTPQGAPVVEDYFLCFTGNNIGVYHQDDLVDTLCDYYMGAVPHEWVDVSEFVECGEAVATDEPTWGTLKGMYR